MEEIKTYGELFQKLELTELTVQEGDKMLTMKKDGREVLFHEKMVDKKEALKEAKIEEEGVILYSPLVGVFYESPGPGEAPFVTLGDRVEKGKVVAIVESMKMMNDISSQTSGRIIEILVENGQLVEYHQPLFRIQEE